MRAKDRINPQSEPATFAETIELHEMSAGFLKRLLILIENAGMRFEAPMIRDPRVRDSRLKLATRLLREPFSRATLAAECGLSAAQLDRLWKKELDATPANYWNRRRVETACTLLQGDALSIKEVAYETGFDHPSQFSFWFSQNLGESPRRFRARHERV